MPSMCFKCPFVYTTGVTRFSHHILPAQIPELRTELRPDKPYTSMSLPLLFWSYLFVYTVFFVGGLLLAYDTIGHSVWCQLGYHCCDYSWILSDFYMTMYFLSLVILPFLLLYATFFCCTIVISVIGSLGFLTVVLNDITPLLSPVFYIITCLYLECLFLDLSSGTMVILSSLPVKKCVQPTHPGCALEKLVGKLEGKAPRRRLYFWFLFCSLLFCLGLR